MSVLEHSLVYKPFKYPWAMEFAVEHEKLHWGEWEITLQEDLEQWKKGEISDVEKNHITQILRLFTQSDVAVANGYCENFIPKFKNNEIRSALLSISAREGIHQRAYALLNETLGFPDSDYSLFLDVKAMSKKVEFMMQGDSSTHHNTAMALVQSTINEGVSLFSAFVMLMNYQRMGKMAGTCKVVEWSIRDESQHVEFITKLFRTFCEEHPAVVNDNMKKEIYQRFRQAVKLEDKIIDLAYDMGTIEGLDAEEVKQYIRYISDRRLIQLGLKGNYRIKENPLPWLDWMLSNDNHTNFFEQTVSDYSKDGLVGDWW